MSAVLPASVINAFSTATIDSRLLLLPLAGALVVALLLASSFLLAPILGLQGTTRAAFLVSLPTLEIGTIGYAVMSVVFGPSGLVQLALFDLGNALFFFTVVGLLAHALGKHAERFQFTAASMQLLKSPVIWGYLIGFVMNLAHNHIALLSNLLTSIAPALLLLIMMLVALEFEFSWSSLSLPTLTIYLKTAIGITLGCVVAALLGFTGVARIAIVMGSAMPASLCTMVYAKEHSLDTQFVASMLSFALPVAIIIAPLLASAPH